MHPHNIDFCTVYPDVRVWSDWIGSMKTKNILFLDWYRLVQSLKLQNGYTMATEYSMKYLEFRFFNVGILF